MAFAASSEISLAGMRLHKSHPLQLDLNLRRVLLNQGGQSIKTAMIENELGTAAVTEPKPQGRTRKPGQMANAG